MRRRECAPRLVTELVCERKLVDEHRKQRTRTRVGARERKEALDTHATLAPRATMHGAKMAALELGADSKLVGRRIARFGRRRHEVLD